MSLSIIETAKSFQTAPVSRPFRTNRLQRLFVKPPPTENFDLDAILAFEDELDAKLSGAAEDAMVDGDDDLIDDFETDGADAIRSYTIPSELGNKRIDAAISLLEPDLSRSHCGLLVTGGLVSVLPPTAEAGAKPSVITRKSHKVVAGSVLTVHHLADERPTDIVAQDLPLNIIFEDEHMIVINKAAGMVVHPAAGNWDGTVVNALAFYLANVSPYGRGEFVQSDGRAVSEAGSGINVEGTDGEVVSFRPGIVHRLDKGTTGILVVAKTHAALTALSSAFASRTVKKTYVAITVGNPGRRVVIDKPIGRHPIHRQRMRVVPDPSAKNSSNRIASRRLSDTAFASKPPSQQGRRALSFVDTLAFDGKLSVVEVRIETGRTHQIRVHLQDRHTPIYGDEIYGLSDWNKRLSKTHGVERPLLHAARLELDHPVTGKHMILRAPMADDMIRTVEAVWPQGKEERPDLFEVTED